MGRECGWCGASVISRRADARYCSTAHRVAAHRAAKADPIPAELRELDRWVRYSPKKVPLTTQGTPASSTNPDTWTSYDNARASSIGAGIGLILNGDGIGCHDLDHCIENGQINAEARDYLASLDAFYTETSPSGTGLHAWVKAPKQAGWKRTIGTLSVEFYTTGRYITVTGQPL